MNSYKNPPYFNRNKTYIFVLFGLRFHIIVVTFTFWSKTMTQTSIQTIRTSDGRLYLFFVEDHSLFYKQLVKKHASTPQKIISGIADNYSVATDDKGILYLIGIDAEHHLFLCRQKWGESWEIKRISELNIYPKTFFKLFSSGNALSLVYTMPDTGTEYQRLICVNCVNGKWDSPTLIDKLIPFAGKNFHCAPIEKKHILLFYRNSENTVVSRELLLFPLIIGKPKPVLSAALPVVDFSSLIEDEKIYLLFALKKRFSTQLIFKYRYGSDFSSPVTLWEGGRLDSCALMKSRNKIFAVWASQGQYFGISSDNMGESFQTPFRFQNAYTPFHCKVDYQDFSSMQEIFSSTNLFIDTKDSYRLLLVEHLYPEFLPEQKAMKSEMSEKPVIAAVQPQIEILQNRISQYESDLSQNSEKIADLTRQLSDKNSDFVKANLRWREQGERMHSEIESLTESSAKKDQQIQEYTHTIKSLTAENQALKNTKKLLEEEIYRLNHSDSKETDG